MYSIGDVVVYGNVGICKVEAVGAPSLSSASANKDYYTLAMVHKGGRIYAPTDTRISMRRVLSRDAALSLIKCIPAIDESVFEARDMGSLKQHYESLLATHDCCDLIHVIKSVYVKKESLARNGKCLGQVEVHYMKRAEEMLYDELAVALEIPRDDVKGYVEARVQEMAN